MSMWRDKNKPPTTTKNGEDKPLTPEQAELRFNEQLVRRMEFVVNAVRGMNKQWQDRLDQRRNYEKECGHPEAGAQISAEQYQEFYDRDPIAARAIEVWPKECWQMNPIVYEDEREKVTTRWERRIKQVANSIGGTNYNREENLNAINEYLCRLQIQAGIGRYGVLFIGIDDGLDPRFPARGWKYPDSSTDYGIPDNDYFGDYQLVQNQYAPYSLQRPVFGPGPTAPERQGMPYTSLGPTEAPGMFKPDAAPTDDDSSDAPAGTYRNILYMRVFPEVRARIHRYEQNRAHPRFGQPVQYEFIVNDPNSSPREGETVPATSIIVHWSRCVHVPSKVRSDEVHGTPVCQTFVNRLIDLKKLYGGSAEMYWLGALPPIVVKTDPSLGGDVDVDMGAAKNEFERLFNGLQRWVRLNGLDADTLNTQVVDPTPQIDKHVEAICIDLETPIRIFKGSERGNLASEQDDENWKGRVRGYNERYTIPRVVRPFYNRLIDLNVLPVPKNGYKIFWPDISTQTNTDKATVAEKLVRTIMTYVTGNCQTVVPPMYFLTTILGGFFTREESEAILEEAEKWVAENEKKEMEKQKKMIEEGLVADPTAEPNPINPSKPKTGATTVSATTGQQRIRNDTKPKGDDTREK